MKSFISRKKEKLLVFLLVSMLALPLAYAGCHGKGQITTGAETEDLTLEAEPVVSLDDQLAELRAEFEAKIEELKKAGVTEDQDALAKAITQKEELDKLLAELKEVNDQLEDKEKELSDLEKEEAEEEAEEVADAAEAAGGAITSFKLSFLEEKQSKIISAATAVVAAGVDAAEVEAELEEKVESAKVSLEVGFCSTLKTSDCKKFKSETMADLSGTVVIKGKDLEGFPGDLAMKDTRVIRLYNDSGKKIHIATVQIGINGKLFYIAPFYNRILMPDMNAPFNQQDDWTGIFYVKTTTEKGRVLQRCNMREGKMHVFLDNIDISNELRDDMSARLVDDPDMSDIRGLDITAANTFSWKLRGPGGNVWQARGGEGLFGFTAPLGEGYALAGNLPIFRVRAHGSLSKHSKWCMDKFQLTLVRISDLLREDPFCYTYYRGINRHFRRGGTSNRQAGPYTTIYEDCAFIQNYKGDGSYDEGPFAPGDWYRYEPSETEIVEVEEEPEVEETWPQAIQDAIAELQKGISAAAEIPDYKAGVVAANTLIGVAKEKLGEKAKAFLEATEEAQKTCLQTEMDTLGDAIHAMQLDAVRATIALRKAQLALIDGKLNYLLAGDDQQAQVAALVNVSQTVTSNVTVVIAERDAALVIFNAVKAVNDVEGVCTEAEALLVLPSADDPDAEAPEGTEEEAQEGEGEEEEATPSP